MSWPASLFSALLTGILGLLVAGAVAALAVDWYNISPREGGSGYFVVFMALLGLVAGLIIGLVVARVVAGGAHPGFLRALGLSVGVVVGIGLVVAGVARTLADVPPTIDGESLLLAVEVRWPADQKERPVTAGPDEPSLSLHSIPHFSHTVRISKSGPLWLEDAHQVDGRWVAPGAVEVFTSRGIRMMSVNIGDAKTQGFQVPLGAFPGKKSLEWSDWLPKFRPGVAVPAGLLSFRYRTVKMSQPVRTETIGPFSVTTRASGFYPVERGKQTMYSTSATFGFGYRGQPLAIEGKTADSGDATERFDRVDEVALVSGPRNAFLIHADSPTSSSYCFLVSDREQRAPIEFVAQCSNGIAGQVLTSDTAVFRAAGEPDPVRGRIDRSTYARPGLYRIGLAIVDTRSLTVRRYTPDRTYYDIPSVPPLGISPDERSFVTYATASGSASEPVLLVTDFVASHTYSLPIDPVRMRYAKFDSLDPAWLDHHFEWRRGTDGVDRLAERAHFVPLPWRGELSTYGDGQTYRIEKATEALRGALIDFLVKEFQAARQPADSGAYEVPVIIGGKTVNVAFSTSGDSPYVAVSMGRGSEDSGLIAGLAERFNAALATGRFDSLNGGKE